MAIYPVRLDVTSPLRFERIQLLLRVLLAVVLGWIGITAGWLACALFGVLPLVAAVVISTYGSQRYADDVGPRIWRVLGWLMQLSAYMGLIVDRFPTGDLHPVKLEIRFARTPTVGSALLRLLTSIPSAFVLALLWFVAGFVWIIQAIVVLVGAAMPESLLAFQRGTLRWQTRLLAYHASLVDEYPPFAFDTGPIEMLRAEPATAAP